MLRPQFAQQTRGTTRRGPASPHGIKPHAPRHAGLGHGQRAWTAGCNLRPLRRGCMSATKANSYSGAAMFSSERISLCVLWAVLGIAAQASPAFSCSLSDINWSISNALSLSTYYWVATGLVFAAIVALEIYRKALSSSVVLSAFFVVFHPRWTIPPTYNTACTFENVFASQLVLEVICTLLAWNLFSFIRTRSASPANAP